MTEERTYCVVCAWRATCQKKYTFESSGQMRCVDYCRDLSLKPENAEKDKDDS